MNNLIISNEKIKKPENSQILKKNEKTFFSFEEAALYLSLAKSTLYKLTSSGKITYYKPNGKLVLFHKDDLDNWVQGGKIPSLNELRGGVND